MTLQLTTLGRAASLAALTVALAPAAFAQRAAKDNAQADLRAPTAAESKALERAAARSQAAGVGMLSGQVNPQPQVLPNGTVMQELTTDSQMYSVARKNADGSVSTYCVNGNEAAERVMRAKAVRSQVVAGKAHTHAKETAYELK